VKPYRDQFFDGGGTTSGMTWEELREHDEFLRLLAEREGISYERQGFFDWLGEQRANFYENTPTGQALSRGQEVINRELDHYEQSYMKPLAIAGQAFQAIGSAIGTDGRQVGSTVLDAVAPGLGYFRDRRSGPNTGEEHAARLFDLVSGSPYEPGDVTGYAIADQTAAAFLDPTNFIPGGGAANATRRSMGLIDDVMAPGLRQVAERAEDTVLTPVRKPAKTAEEIVVNQNIQAAVDRIIPPENPLSNPEIKRRFDYMIDIGNQHGATRWYGSPVIKDLFSRALNFLDPRERQRQVQGTLAMFSVLNGATSPRTKVFNNINKALVLLTNAQAGRLFPDLVRMAEENPHVPRKPRRSGPPYRKNRQGEMVGTTVTPEDELYMRLTSPYDLEVGLSEAMFPSHMTRQAFELGTLSGQKTSSFDLNFAADELNPNHQIAIDAVTIDTHFLPQFLWGLGMDYRTVDGRKEIVIFLDVPNKQAYELEAEDFDKYIYGVVSQTPRYAIIEQAAQRVARSYGLRGRDFQSVLWVGGKEISRPADLRPFSETFMENMRIHAQRLGTSVEEVARKIAMGDLKLADIMGQDLAMYARYVAANMASTDWSEEEQEEQDDGRTGGSFGAGGFHTRDSFGASGESIGGDLYRMMDRRNTEE